jgi:hypothetical protein
MEQANNFPHNGLVPRMLNKKTKKQYQGWGDPGPTSVKLSTPQGGINSLLGMEDVWQSKGSRLVTFNIKKNNYYCDQCCMKHKQSALWATKHNM